MDRSTLMMAMAAMADRKAVACDVAMRLGLTTTTLYVSVNGDGTPKAAGQALLDGMLRPGAAGKARSSFLVPDPDATLLIKRHVIHSPQPRDEGVLCSPAAP